MIICSQMEFRGTWRLVCNQLGISENNTTVTVRFCNIYGCNFDECPHLTNKRAASLLQIESVDSSNELIKPIKFHK